MIADNLRAGDIGDIRIESVAFGGQGVGRIQGKVVFVPFTVEGDEVEIEITSVRKKFALGIMRRILKASPYRTVPVCGYFGECGGCQMQHIAYEHQLVIKERQTGEIFTRLGKFPRPPLREIIASPRSLHYRGKADYHVQANAVGRPFSLGFVQTSKDAVLDIEGCEIVEESINRSYRSWRDAVLRGEKKAPRDRQTIWSASGENSCLEAQEGSLPALITRTVGDRRFVVPSAGFFQVNSCLVSTLVEKVLSLADLKGGETVVDAYCGVGLFSIFLAPLATTVVGIEINPEAVKCAGANMREAGCTNVSFLQGDVGEVMKRWFAGGGWRADVVILDPPRTGCDRKVLEAISGMKAQRVIYISCNPATQARDVRQLVESGFSLESLQPLDMFPQTAHIEVIAVLRGKGTVGHQISALPPAPGTQGVQVRQLPPGPLRTRR